MATEAAALLVTCLVDVFYPEVGVAAVQLLRRAGIRVSVPEGQTCCGLPLFNSGYHREAASIARHMIPRFADAARVVVPSGSCAWMVKAEYPHLFPDDPGMAQAAKALAAKTDELSQFLLRVVQQGGESRGASHRSVLGLRPSGPPGASSRGARPRRVTYHDSCHLLRGLGESEAPRALIRRLPGVELVELPGADECCGFGGSFSVRLPDVSGAILKRKLANIRAAGADTVVACDAGCLLQMAGGATRAGERAQVRHLAELLAEEAGDDRA